MVGSSEKLVVNEYSVTAKPMEIREKSLYREFIFGVSLFYRLLAHFISIFCNMLHYLFGRTKW